MELNQLRTFVAVAEEKHLTRAAERLFTSQPAVSAQLKALEETLGVKLFERTPKGMSLTSSGEHLLVKAKATLEAASTLLSEAQSIQGKVMGSIKIGVNSDFDFLRLPNLLSHCSNAYPGLKLSFENSMSADIIREIRKGKFDSGFFFGLCASADLHVVTLDQTQTAVVAPKSWENKIANATPETLSELPWIYTTERCPFYVLKEALFNDAHVVPKKTVFVDSEDAIRSLVKAGSGISLLRADDADKAEAEGWGIRWGGATMTIPLNIAVQKNRLSEPAIQVWLSEIQNAWNLTPQEESSQQVG